MKGSTKIILIAIIIILVIGAAISSFILFKKKQPGNGDPGSEDPALILNNSTLVKRLINPEDISLDRVNVTPEIPRYELPLDTGIVQNYDDFTEKIYLRPKAVELLEGNGFAVINPSSDMDDFAAYYSSLKSRDIPIVITSDSLLHYYHIFFNTTLMKLERDLFFDDIWQMSKELLEQGISQYNDTEGDLKESAKRNVAYLSVAMELLRPKNDQIMNDQALKEEYCSGWPNEYCNQIIQDVKEQYGDKASFKYFSEADVHKYSFEIPVFVRNEVKEELELINNHDGWDYSPLFIYQEDYSQYIPRGHYTKSEKLKNYFRALMWYGRMTALVKGSPTLSKGESQCTGPMDGIISVYDAKIQTFQGLLIANSFNDSVKEKWQRIYTITSFFVGFSDDLGPYEYSEVLDSFFEDGIDLVKIEEKYSEIKDVLLNFPFSPKIYSGLGKCEMYMPCPPLSNEEVDDLKIQAKKLLEETKGFRLMGQRFTIDSWLFSEIVSPYSGEYTGEKLELPTDKKPFTFAWDDPYSNYRDNRPFSWVKTNVAACPPPAAREVKGFPRGLDIMAIFGSQRAKEILDQEGDTSYSDYEKKFTELKESIDSLPISDWFQNVYWNWLYVLKSLNQEFGTGYQTFMQTKAWQDKELNTMLASWAELRHDTILYVKQSYTMAELGAGPPPEPVVGYVEPVPEFYARLLTLTKMTNDGLKRLVPENELKELNIETTLDSFTDILDKLLKISIKELENKELTEEEYRFIEDFGSTSEHLIELASGGQVDEDIYKTTMVADVHTEGNTEKVLEEGVGYIKTLVAAYRMPQGHILLGAGPVFSYYEFKQPMTKRLTDETWRQMLRVNPPPEPDWINSFSE